VATLSSAILGRPRDELIGEDIRRHRRAMQVATGAAAAIACFGAVAAWQWVEATQQRNRAREQAAIALSRQLAAQAASSLDESSVLGALLSLEAYRAVEDEDVRHRFEARNSMLLALQRDPRAVSILPLIANGVAFAPGGRTLAVAGEDRSVRLLDVARRAPLGEPLSGHTDAVSTVAFNAQGTMLASGGRDQKIFVRRFPGGDLLHEWNGNGGILALAFSPRGDTLASADGHTVQIWQLGQRSSPGTRLPGGPGFAESVSFSPDGKTLASAGEDGVMLWDVDPTPRRRQRLESELMTTVAFAPDGRTLAAGGSNGLRFWDVRRRVRLRRHRPGDVRSISFSADGKRLVSGHGDYTVRLWDVPSASQVGPPLRGHSGWAWGVAFGPDGRIVASASYDATVRLWRAGVRAPPARSVPNPGASQEELASIVGVGFRPDDKALVSADENGWIGRWRGRSPRLVSTSLAPTAEGDRRIVLRSDGNVLAVATENGSVGLWDLAGREARSELVAGSDVDAKTIAFTDDGEYLVAGSEDGTVRVWDVDSNEVVVRLETKREVGVVASRRTADVVATAANDAITLWDTDRRAPLGDPLRGHSGGIADLAFSPDGDVLASTGLDGTIRLWNVDTRRPLGEPLRGHTDAVVDLTFAPAGLTLASGSRDKTVRLWDIARRTQLGQPLPAGDQVSTVAFSADGRSVAAGGTFGRITVWRDILPGASIAEWRKRLCPIAQRNLTRAEWEEFLPDEPYRATCSEFPLDRLATPGG
jgi:WD40 repeat protein